jgi:nucleotide-binding universal stress UspA family protein
MKILLAIDESRFSAAAIRMVIAQNRPGQTQIHVLHVVEPLESPYYPELIQPYPASIADINRSRLKAGRTLASQISEKLRKAGFKVVSSVRSGHVRSIVVDVARKWHADLIVVGSHGRTGMRRILLGSVSDYVARHAHCSVQIVRRRTK